MMRLRLGLLVPALLALALPAPAAARGCAPERAERVLERAAEVVVLARGDTLEACRRSNGRRMELPDAEPTDPLAIAGTFVAWTYLLTPYRGEPAEGYLRVRDLARPDVHRRAFLKYFPREVAVDARGRAAALTDGTVIVLRGNDQRRLAYGSPGTMRGLAFDGADVTWKHGGRRQRAPADLPASCALERGTDAVVQGDGAVIAYRNTGDSDAPFAPSLCRFSGGGWVALGGRGASLAGSFVAVEEEPEGGRNLVTVRDVASLEPVGPPARPGDRGTAWALGADGTVYEPTGTGFLGHRRDGTLLDVPYGRPPSAYDLGVDDVTRAIVWFGQPGPLPIPPAPGSPAAACVQPGEVVRAEGPEAVVVESRRLSPGLRFGDGHYAWTVCDPATGARQLLAEADNNVYVTVTRFGDFAVSGPYVAYARSFGGRGALDHSETVGVVDARGPLRPAVLQLAAGAERGVTARPLTEVVEVAVDPAGRLAYLTERGAYVVDPGGTRRQVDRAGSGELRGLAIAGDRVTWAHAGRQVSAPLTLPSDACDGLASEAAFANAELVAVGTTHRQLRVCSRATGRITDVAGRRPQLAGPLIATYDDDEQVRVIDAATGTAVGAPVAVPWLDGWLLADDGAVVVVRRAGVVAHCPGGRVRRLGTSGGVLTIDSLLRRLPWDGAEGARGTLPLHRSCARSAS